MGCDRVRRPLRNDVRMPPGVSLSQHGLQAPGGLDCPAGGFHHVAEAQVILAAAARGGLTSCQKCGAAIELVAIEPGDMP